MSSGKASILLTADGAQQVLSELQKVTQALNAATAGRAFEGAAQRRQRAADSVSRTVREQARAVERSERDQRRAIEKTARAAERAARERKQRFGQRALTGVSIAAGLGVPIGPALNLGFAAHSGGEGGLAAAGVALAVGGIGRAAIAAAAGLVRLGDAALEAAESNGQISSAFLDSKDQFQTSFGEIGAAISEGFTLYAQLNTVLVENEAALKKFAKGVTDAANLAVAVGITQAQGLADPLGPSRIAAAAIPGPVGLLGGLSIAIQKTLEFMVIDSGKQQKIVSEKESKEAFEKAKKLDDARLKAEQEMAKESTRIQEQATNAVRGDNERQFDEDARKSEQERKKRTRERAKEFRDLQGVRGLTEPGFALGETLDKVLKQVENFNLDPAAAGAFLNRERIKIEEGQRKTFKSQAFTSASALRDRQQAATLSTGPSKKLDELKKELAQANLKKIKLSEKILETLKNRDPFEGGLPKVDVARAGT